MANRPDGLARGLSPLEAKRRVDQGDDTILLDVRTPGEFEFMRLPYPNVTHIPLGALRARAGGLPKDQDILSFCKVSMCGYEAQRILNAAGYTRVWFIEGGLVG